MTDGKKKPEDIERKKDFVGEFSGKKEEKEVIDTEEVPELRSSQINEELRKYESELRENPTPKRLGEIYSSLEKLDDDISRQGRFESKKFELQYGKDIDRLGAVAQTMQDKNWTYDDASIFVKGIKEQREEENHTNAKRIGAGAVIGGLALAAGAGALGYFAKEKIEDIQAGEKVYTQSTQELDDVIPPAYDGSTATDAQVGSIAGTGQSQMDPGIFFGKVYPSLSEELQDSILRGDLVSEYTDGNISNMEVGTLFLNKDKRGEMSITYEMKRVDEDTGAHVTHLQSPIPLTDAQAYKIDSSYKSNM